MLISNGFRSGEWVEFLNYTRDAGWVRDNRVSTGECTDSDDQDFTDYPVSITGKRGIVGGFRVEGIDTHVESVLGFFGFTTEELEAPAPELGWTERFDAFNAHFWSEVRTLAEYLIARFVHESFTVWSSMKDGVHSMPYVAGDQPAESYVLIKGGKLIDGVTGAGDRTPYLTASDEEILAAGQLKTSCFAYDQMEEAQDEENRFWAAAQKLGVEESYRKLQKLPYSVNTQTQIKALDNKIWGQVVRTKSNERAQKDKSGILRRLLNHFRRGNNPLKSLRREKGGVWKYSTKEVKDVPANSVVFEGDNWWVVWTKP